MSQTPTRIRRVTPTQKATYIEHQHEFEEQNEIKEQP